MTKEYKKIDKFELSERMTKFSESVISFTRSLPLDTISRPIISQLIRSATSIGANYMEAINACSRRDFRNKIFICKKEAQECVYWLRLIIGCYPEDKEKIIKLRQECNEFLKILQKTTNTLYKNDNLNDK